MVLQVVNGWPLRLGTVHCVLKNIVLKKNEMLVGTGLTQLSVTVTVPGWPGKKKAVPPRDRALPGCVDPHWLPNCSSWQPSSKLAWTWIGCGVGAVPARARMAATVVLTSPSLLVARAVILHSPPP